MKIRKIIAIVLCSAMLFTLFAVNAFAAMPDHNQVFPQAGAYHDIAKLRVDKGETECYSVSGLSQTSVYAYSFHTAKSNTTMKLEAISWIDVTYIDGTTDLNNYQSDEKYTNSFGDGVQPCTEVFYKSGIKPFKFTMFHWYYMNDNQVHNETYDAFYGDYFD